MSEKELQTLPNVGPATARLLQRLGFNSPAELREQDPHELYERGSVLIGQPLDPCVLDTFVAVVDFTNGAPPRPWWYYSRQRKAPAHGENSRP